MSNSKRLPEWMCARQLTPQRNVHFGVTIREIIKEIPSKRTQDTTHTHRSAIFDMVRAWNEPEKVICGKTEQTHN